MTRWGALLVNLGTPDAPTTGAVRRYLREFLGDPRVIDLPAPLRLLLLHLVILPLRPRASAAAYRTIWGERGSPLLYHSLDLTELVRARLGPDVPVELGMRYGRPSIAGALERLRAAGAEEVVVLPLYPQYAASSTASSLAEAFRVAASTWDVPSLRAVPAFHADPGFLAAWEAVARPALEAARAERVVFSFHGLPERQIRKSDPTGAHCLASAGCCEALGAANRRCYRAQSYATARDLAARLGLAPGGWEVAFQSRLGRTPWIRPYTDVRARELAAEGVKRLAVLCPAFVADCLETVEEIGGRLREDFLAHGGEELVLVPSLNAHPAWADAVAALLRAHAPPGAGQA